MDNVEIIDLDGIKINVDGIYYISNNNYYFIYTKEELDEENHVILYITKVLKEVTNTSVGQVPTGYLIGVKIEDENEYNIVKNDIINIIDEKTNNKEAVVRYLDISMLVNYKVKDYRIFKLEKSVYEKVFNHIDTKDNNVLDNYKMKYEEELAKNSELNKVIEQLNSKIDRLKEILND